MQMIPLTLEIGEGLFELREAQSVGLGNGVQEQIDRVAGHLPEDEAGLLDGALLARYRLVR